MLQLLISTLENNLWKETRDDLGHSGYYLKYNDLFLKGDTWSCVYLERECSMPGKSLLHQNPMHYALELELRLQEG